MYFKNKEFYPTPQALVAKMISKIKGSPSYILEPSAGKGNIVDEIQKSYRCRSQVVYAMEIDPSLQIVLKGKGIDLLHDDFLNFEGPDKFDLIIANPPFRNGDLHLLKAIDMVYSGQIIFLLNANTIKKKKNPILSNILNKLNAEIEYIQGAFMEAERKTFVEVALVNINIKKKIESDLFEDLTEAENLKFEEIRDENEIVSGNKIDALVEQYNVRLKAGQETLYNFYKNSRYLGPYLQIRGSQSTNRTDSMQHNLNSFCSLLRHDYWKEILKLDVITKRLTRDEKAKFHNDLKYQSKKDFTASNIRTFVLNVINGYKKRLENAVESHFNYMTKEHAWYPEMLKNKLHFNGWKTNDAFKIANRVILPMGDDSFWSNWDGWKLWYWTEEKLDDIDLVMNSFDGLSKYKKISEAIKEAFKSGQSKGIESSYFKINVYKKGTIHLKFKDKNILRRFNICACKGKKWLPHDYGKQSYSNLSRSEKAIVEAFEHSVTDYIKNPLINSKSTFPKLMNWGSSEKKLSVNSQDAEVDYEL